MNEKQRERKRERKLVSLFVFADFCNMLRYLYLSLNSTKKAMVTIYPAPPKLPKIELEIVCSPCSNL